MSVRCWILDGKTPQETDDLLAWAKMLESPERIVKQTELPNGVTVSTVFLGLDHSFGSEGPPIIFETLVFGGPHNETMDRYSTWDEAEAGHNRMLEKVNRD
jgi:hypothetical protein